jgi:hypothetical protein
MSAYGAQHRIATAAGCRNCERSRTTRQRVSLVIGALARIGRTDLIVPQAQDMGLARTLDALAAGTDANSQLGEALRRTLSKTPKALAAFCRRNPAWVQAEIAKAQNETGGPP